MTRHSTGATAAQGIRAVVWQWEGSRFDPPTGVTKRPGARQTNPQSLLTSWLVPCIAADRRTCVWMSKWEHQLKWRPFISIQRGLLQCFLRKFCLKTQMSCLTSIEVRASERAPSGVAGSRKSAASPAEQRPVKGAEHPAPASRRSNQPLYRNLCPGIIPYNRNISMCSNK